MSSSLMILNLIVAFNCGDHKNGESIMLVLSRRSHESVVVGVPGRPEQMLKVTVLEVIGGRVLLGFDVADDVPVHRWEVWKRICAAEGSENANAELMASVAREGSAEMK
jgi:carbon storage regulator CsrA